METSAALPKWAESFVDKAIHLLQNETLRKKIQIMLLQPFLQYFLELIFPYIIIVCVVFGIMMISILSILALLLFQLQGATAAVASVANA
jgi:hypothetical protein